jgi:inner membrane protein
MSQSIEAPQPVLPDANLQTPTDPAPAEAPPVYLQPLKVLASPDPLSPFRWYTVTDFGPLYQLADVNTRSNTFVPGQATLPKLNPSPALLAAEASPLGRVYLDWSPMPILSVIPPADPLASNHTVVNFADPRFMGNALLLHTAGRTPLSGSVELDSSNRVIRQTLDGKPQRP